MPEPIPFELGLTLTGTVSAGAYTAGVMDFLFEALEEWEIQKAANRTQHGNDYSKWDTPWHEVVIKGMSGASGGGTTIGLILNNIGNRFPHIKLPPPDQKATGNDLFDVWVSSLGIMELLSTEDLQNEATIYSLLNADAIPNIAEKILTPGRFGTQDFRPYIDDHLYSIITVANLRGMPYVLKYNNPSQSPDTYYEHTDHVIFEYIKNGVGIRKDAYALPMNSDDPLFMAGIQQLKAACLATCAFPLAFKAQPLSKMMSYYANETGKDKDDPVNEWAQNGKGIYDFLCVDGGLLNTDPFELLHTEMVAGTGKPYNPKDPRNVKRAILIVAPLELFEKPLDKYDIKKNDILHTVTSSIESLRDDALLSDEEIKKALREDYYSRYIITPIRSSTKEANDRITPAITGTVLGTFGAFLSRDFRVHDFFLGRRNAQQFLRRHFAVPVTDDLNMNPVFGPLNVEANLSKFIFSEQGVRYFPIIPLCGKADDETHFPKWPKMQENEISEIQDALEERLGSVLKIAKNSLNLNWVKNIIASLIVGGIKSSIAETLTQKIIKSLSDNDL